MQQGQIAQSGPDNTSTHAQQLQELFRIAYSATLKQDREKVQSKEEGRI